MRPVFISWNQGGEVPFADILDAAQLPGWTETPAVFLLEPTVGSRRVFVVMENGKGYLDACDAYLASRDIDDAEVG